MASGRQLSEENYAIFLSWMAGKTVDDFRDMVTRGQLSRQEIARECGFARSVLLQNPRVREALRALEDELRQRGVLPPLVEPSQDATPPDPHPPQKHSAIDQRRLHRLECENASLRAEVSKLQTETQKLRSNLAHYRLLESVLGETGRLPH